MDDHATFPGTLDTWLFSNNSATTHHRDFDLARHEHWLPFPSDVVGVLYPLATLDTGDYRIDWNDDTSRYVYRGWTNTLGGAEIN